MNTHGQTRSSWMDTTEDVTFPSLSTDVSCDVCVVGAGITGLTAAYLLAQAGKSVVVIEAREVGSGESGRTTAHITNVLDDRFYVLRRYHGLKRTKLAAASHIAAIDQVEKIIQTEHIECDFQRIDGHLFQDPTHPEQNLEKEFALCQKMGVPVTRQDQGKLGQQNIGPTLVFPRQGQFHMMKYLYGLCRVIEAKGGKIFTETRMTNLVAGNPHVAKTHTGHTVTAKAVIQATNAPIYAPTMQFAKQPPYRSYVVGIRMPKGTFSPALFWDMGHPYHYVRMQPLNETHELLMVGGEDHRTGTHDDCQQRYNRLEHWARSYFPQATDVQFRWSGQVLESIDRLAYIGEYKKMPGIFYSTGDSGMGMTHGTIGAMLMSDLILGRPNQWQELYAPTRLRVGSLWQFMREGMELTWEYFSGWFLRSGPSVEQLKPKQGTVIKQGKKRLAVYKDEHGNIHTRSAVCPHMKCIINWNTGEQTWDCPCHGSRFDAQGKILNAPTNGQLPPRKVG